METSVYRIGNICSIKSGKRLPAGFDFSVEPTQYKYIRSRDIKAGKIYLDDVAFIDEEIKKRINKYIINTGDVAITIVANIGDIGYATPDCDGINLTENAVRLTGFDKSIVFSKYLSYYLSQPSMKQYMENLAAGAAQAKLGIYKIEKMKVQLPDVSIQKAVVDIIEKFDNLIEVNNKRIKVLETMAENLYKEWFVRFRFPGHETAEFKNGIPKGWEIKKAKEVIQRLPFGKLYKAEDTVTDGTVIVIDQSQDQYVGFHNDDPSHIATPEHPIAIFGDHSCKYRLMIRPFSLSENVVPYIGRDGMPTTYLYYLTHGIVETTEYKRHWTEFMAKKVLVAPLFLQERFSSYIMPIEEAILNLEEQSRNLIKQRDLLLPRLMSGKLEV